MATASTILKPDANGNFSIEKLARADLVRIDIADVDLILTAKDGTRYLLPNAGVDAMGDQPPKVTFSDSDSTLDKLLAEVGVVSEIQVTDSSPTSQTPIEGNPEALTEEEQEELEKELEELQKELETKTAEAEKKAEEFEKYKQEHDKDSDSTSVTVNTETAIEKMVEEAKRIEENLHRSDKEYSEPVHFQPPPAPFSATPGLPAPISLTPIVTISLGNVVGTTVVGNNIYGGGGAVGSDAGAVIGARNPLQFSPASIAGTSGNDVIYTSGPLVGNPNPAADRTNNAKEFLLNVAGYFTQLNDIIISGVPAGVTFLGAADNGNGTFTVPASSITDGVPVTMIYDQDLWRNSGSNTFDLAFNVSGLSTRGVSFQTVQSFRFLYLDVTDVSQVTNQTLIYEAEGQTKQIYVLPTLAQPSIINSGAGDDIIYGGRSQDIITSGNGNNQFFTGLGDDSVTTGNGSNTVSLGDGNNILVSGSGNDTVTAGNGDNTITAGDGVNSVTLSNGNNTITTGTGDDTIIAGIGAVTVNAGDGNNQITTGGGGIVNVVTGSGNDQITTNDGGGTISAGAGTNIISVTADNYTITAGAGNDTVTAGNGNNVIDAGGGTNAITVGSGNNSITTGAGNDNVMAGNGNNFFSLGLGTNSLTAGTGNNTLDYSVITTTAAIISLAAGTSTGTGLSDTFSGIQNLNGTTLSDTITGTTLANIIHGGSGNDTITGNGGNDTLYGDEGNDTITGGLGNDIIYGGNGNNTVYTGTAGNDFVYGGTGNNTYISQHAGVSYDGTNGAALLAGQINTIDYSATNTNMTINLLSGNGSGGAAEGDRYALSANGFNTINRILAGSGNDMLTGSNADDTLIAGGGNDTITAGAGTNTIDAGGGTNTINAGIGADSFINGLAGSDTFRYEGSVAGIVINLDSVSRSFVNSLGTTVNVAAFSGGNKGVTAADLNSFSVGDTFAPPSGTNSGVDEIYGSAFGDVIFGSSGAFRFNTGIGTDFFYGGAGAELVSYSPGTDRIDGGGGVDTFWSASPGGSTYSVATFVYLDGNADTNSNGIADYTDRGITSLTSGGVAYQGFATGRDTALITNFENLLGETNNDYLVGNNNDNVINGRTGTNTIFGLGGNDTLHSALGSNTIDGGIGTDTVDFSNSFYASGTTTAATVFLADASFFGASDKAVFWGSSLNFQARTGTATYSSIVNVENIQGSALNDVLYGNGSVNTIRGGAGNDIIAGNGGADSLFGDAGDDVFQATAAQVAAVTVFTGGSDNDTVRAAGLAVTAGSISGTKFASIESLDVRNSASGGAYSLNANDITGLADNGTSSRVSFYKDTGDTFTIVTGAGSGALSSVVASSSSTLTTYYLYSDAGHMAADATNRVAILDVYTGT